MKVVAKQRAVHYVADFYNCDLVQFMEDPGQTIADALLAAGLSPHAQTASASDVGFCFLVNLTTTGYLSVQVERDGYAAIDCYVRGGDPRKVVGYLKGVLKPVYFDVMQIGRGITNMGELNGQHSEAGLEQSSGAVVQEGDSCVEEAGEAGDTGGGPSGGIEGPAHRHLDTAQA